MARSSRSKGLKDRKYLSFIAEFPCFVCCFIEATEGIKKTIQKTRTEVAHVGERGMSQKSSDHETIPLCAEHHRTGKFSHHVLGRRFWEYHGLKRDEVVREFNELYEREPA